MHHRSAAPALRLLFCLIFPIICGAANCETFEAANIGDLKTQFNGASIRLTDPKVVTAASSTYSDGSYYIEETSRACGIKVVPTAGLAPVSLWDRITLEGVLSSDSNGERIIIATAIPSKTSGTAIGALGVRGRDVAAPAGLDSSGLLVRTSGWVTYKAEDGSYIYIDDGSATKDATGNKGVRVILNGLATALTNPPSADQYVAVTGIAGSCQDGSKLVRVLRVRSDSDISNISVPATEQQMAQRWIQSNFGSDTQRRPFSFTYGGSASSALLPGWNFTSSTRTVDANISERTLTYTDPVSGLQVRCVSTEYSDFPALEWKLYFKNTGTADTPIIENIQPADFDISGTTPTGDFTLYYDDGTYSQITDFQPEQTSLTPGANLRFSPYGGRPSDKVLPFFNLAKPDGGGIVLGIGWTGKWATSFIRTGTNTTVNIQAGMDVTHFLLHPGEEVRSPGILVLFWLGNDRLHAHNQLRRLLLNHYSPTPGGMRVNPPVAASAAAVAFEATTEANMVQAINNLGAHNFPIDTWWIDAGWYTCPNHINGWAEATGNWDPDPARYPNGLKPVADAAHSKGYKFLLWFEPERVMPGTWLYVNHPEWLVAPANLPPERAYQWNWRMLDFGNPAALAWAKSKFSGMIKSIGIDIYRQDCNLHPIYYWRNGEAANRQGINEIKHVMGMYDYLDTLLRENPNLTLDICAGTGGRVDFEILRRALNLTRSDGNWWDPVADQSKTYGYSFWTPITGIGAVSPVRYDFRSGMGSHMAYCFDYYNSSESTWTTWAQIVNQYKSVKDLFTGDYYPLSSYSVDDNVWMAYQFDRPDLGEGIAQVFRRPNATAATATYTLKGLDPMATYLVTYVGSSSPISKTGAQLMQSGLSFSLAAPGATYVTYRRIQ